MMRPNVLYQKGHGRDGTGFKNTAARTTPDNIWTYGAAEKGEPVVLLVGVSACERRHTVAEHHVGKVKHLLDLKNAVRAPAHVVSCREENRRGVF